MSLPPKVTIRELGPREGFQTLSRVVPTDQKLELISALLKTNVPSIEVTSFVRADRVPQMADAEEIVARLPKPSSSTTFTALYLNKKGYERCVTSPNLTLHGWIYTATSETFLSKNNNCTFADTISGIKSWIDTFKAHNTPFRGVVISTAFGCGYEGKSAFSKLSTVVEAVSKALNDCGVSVAEFCLADTVGLATPNEIPTALDTVRQITSNTEVSLHLHDTRGLGIACAYEGLKNGVTIFESSVGGMGGCPFANGAAGNISTEDFVYLCHELGVETGVSLEAYKEAARLAQRITGVDLPGRLFKVP